MRNTTLELKRKNFDKFCALIKDEFEKGGKKYAGATDKEATDAMTEFDPLYILVTMMKYIWRIKNNDPRKMNDIVKIATYAYIWWLKNSDEVVE